MSSDSNTLLSRKTAQVVLDIVAPGSVLSTVQPLAGSYSNLTHLIESRRSNGEPLRIVVRRYVYGDRARKARVEYRALHFLQDYAVPAPAPLYLDTDGIVLGRPGIVMRFMPGQLIEEPATHPAGKLTWAREFALVLAKIHAIPGEQAKGVLFDADAEATWFLRDGVVPEYMAAHPDGTNVWQLVHDLWPKRQPASSTLVHLDYWRGNVLWEEGHISAVVDWEEAAYGDPAIDVAYCLMELVIMGMIDEADEFLRTYETQRGPVANLAYWQLAAAARPMYNIDGWITDSAKGERFRQFIAEARAKVSL